MSDPETNTTGLAERYARLWENTSPGLHVLDTFLAAAPKCGASELADILRTDLTARWRAGQAVPAEDYIQRLGGEAAHHEAVVDLIYAEYLVREELRLNPQAEEYCQRFPKLADVLRDQFALHAAVDDDETPPYFQSATVIKPLPSETPEEVFPRQFGRYKLLLSLGQGGMGKVYLAQDVLLGRRVAIKVPRQSLDGSPVMIARFLREAQAAAALNDPQLCPVYDVGQVDGVDYLTMPFIAGGALSDRLQDKQPLPPDEAVPIVIKIATALQKAHAAGVIHRDLKPANILINDAGDPVITDFGLAARTENRDPALTEEGGMLGTVAYMPPEQIAYNAAAVGPRSDVYSLGVILYQLLTGRTPFLGAHHDILRKTLTETPVAPSKVCPGLNPCFDEVCLTALEKSPDERFASMSVFAERLAATLAESRKSRRKIARVPILLGAIIVCCALGLWAIPWGHIWKEAAPSATSIAQAEIKKPLFFRTPGFEPWMKEVVAMTPDKQVEAVSRKLKELNPKFDGKVQPHLDNNQVVGLVIQTDHVRDISPVRALDKLYNLWCGGNGPFASGGLEDISPLKGLRLWFLAINDTGVADLSPLRGMKLTGLGCDDSNVADLSPLAGMPIADLVLSRTKVTDLSPLAGMKLVNLRLEGLPKIDLAPLRGMPLNLLSLRDTKVTGVAVLHDLPLKFLCVDLDLSTNTELLRSLKSLEMINDKSAAEFWKEVAAQQAAKTPLYFQTPSFEPWARQVAKMSADQQVEAVAKKLVELNPKFDGMTRPTIQTGVVTGFDVLTDNVRDISPVRALVGLKELWCSTGGPGAKPNAPEDLSPLKGLPLTFLAFNWTRVSDLSPLRGMKLTNLKCDSTNITDLSPLKDMPLKELHLAGNPISDLSPLEGIQLTHLNIDSTPVTDLSPLRGMPLILLDLHETKVTDLSLLKDMPLQFLCLDFNPERDTELVRSIKTLESINIKPAAEFWKEVESGQPGRKP